MSAQVLRNIVSTLCQRQYHDFDSHKIILSGELSDNAWLHVNNTIPEEWLEEEDEDEYAHTTEVWVLTDEFHQLPDGTWTLEDILKSYPTANMVVGMSCQTWQSDDHKILTDVTIYKLPNSKEYWAKIEKEDIKRWEEWLNA